MTTNSKNLAMMLVGFAAIISVGVFSATNTAEASQEDVPGMMGHITLTVYDSDGNIKEYVQTDNAVRDAGRDCLSDNVFGVGGLTCGGGDFRFIGLGTGTSPQTNDVQIPLASGCVRSNAADVGSGDVATSTDNGTTETITMTVIFGGETATGAGIADAACDGVAITEAGLFNNVGAGLDQMFAHQPFSAITLLTADTLEVEWVIAIT